MPNLWQQPLSLYIHLPWCLHKCAYCDFNSHATDIDQFPEIKYIQALIADLEHHIDTIGSREIKSIFIGGGTPSLFSPNSINEILSSCRRLLNIPRQCEITLETNPGTFEYQKFSEFLSVGVNRLSIGAQSFNEGSLKALGRIHSASEATHAVETAHSIGFNNINVDLMFALPDQSIDEALADINHACQLPVNHISYYQLTLEPNTIFHRFPPNLPTSDTSWQIQQNGIDRLADAGYTRYEVSAYSQENSNCIHNVNYWNFGDYLGIGAGAHSKLTDKNNIVRFQKSRQPDSYMHAVSTNTQTVQYRTLGSDDLIFEFMLNSLRLTEGFSIDTFIAATGVEWQFIEAEIMQLVEKQWLIIENSHVKTTPLGYRFLDEVVEKFLPTH